MQTANTVESMRARLAEVVERKRAQMTPAQRLEFDARIAHLRGLKEGHHGD